MSFETPLARQEAGLAVPDMPLSAPGIDIPGRKDPYDVLVIGTEGESRILATYPK